jgi:rRNA maturation RNase YbeY
MAVFYESMSLPVPEIKRRKMSRWIKQVIAWYRKNPGAINYIFCSDEEILQINRQYLNHDYYTDIITFDYTENDTVSGDLFISLDTVKSNAEKFETDYSDELSRVMIHGVLHLCGLKDKSLEEEKLMRLKEEEALMLLEGFK